MENFICCAVQILNDAWKSACMERNIHVFSHLTQFIKIIYVLKYLSGGILQKFLNFLLKPPDREPRFRDY